MEVQRALRGGEPWLVQWIVSSEDLKASSCPSQPLPHRTHHVIGCQAVHEPLIHVHRREAVRVKGHGGVKILRHRSVALAANADEGVASEHNARAYARAGSTSVATLQHGTIEECSAVSERVGGGEVVEVLRSLKKASLVLSHPHYVVVVVVVGGGIIIIVIVTTTTTTIVIMRWW